MPDAPAERPAAWRGLLWIARAAFAVVAAVAVLLTAVWAVMAIGYSNLPWAWLRTAAAAAFAAGTIFVFVRLPPLRALATYAAVFVAVLAWWLLIPPSHDRDWTVDNEVMARARIEGDIVTIDGVRDFGYPDGEEHPVVRWEERSYDLSKLESVDLVLSYWDGNRDIAHMIVSFGFEGGEHVAVSIETRKEKGEGYSAIAGFFKQFELIFVVGDERDFLWVRAALRDEDVYLYPMRYEPEERRELFMLVLDKLNSLAERPEWYNALEHNCTTAWIGLVEGARDVPTMFDIRILLNGWLDELGYERGRIVADETDGLPYEEMRAQHAISELAREIGAARDFPSRVRARMPRRD